MGRKKADVFVEKKSWFGESYASLFLGIIVVVVSAILIVSFVRSRIATQTPSQDTSSESTQEKSGENTYTVIDGDTLWSISEDQLGSGFEWEKIAQANKISDPTNLEAGTKLTIPDVDGVADDVDDSIASSLKEAVESVTQEEQPEKITEEKYTVVLGDNLWDIAVRAYGDGFRYSDIAKENNIENPDLIYPDQVFVIPR